MKNLRLYFPILFLGLATTVPSFAQINGDDSLLAVRGQGKITHEEFYARATRIPEERRFQVIRDRSRMEDMLNQMLMFDQLAADARAEGFDLDPVVIDRMKLAAKEELAKAWLDHYVNLAKPADYSAMAREEFQLNRDKYVTQHQVDVSHILVGTESRSDEEALALAQELHSRLEVDPGQFEALVMEYSDDPSKAGNKGRFTGVKKGDMVPAFETAAFALDVGQLSAPVKTPYGYHLIRKDGEKPPRQRKFQEVRLPLEQQMRKRHNDRVRQEYLREIYEPTMEITRESVANTVERLFGPEVLADSAAETESQ